MKTQGTDSFYETGQDCGHVWAMGYSSPAERENLRLFRDQVEADYHTGWEGFCLEYAERSPAVSFAGLLATVIGEDKTLKDKEDWDKEEWVRDFWTNVGLSRSEADQINTIKGFVDAALQPNGLDDGD